MKKINFQYHLKSYNTISFRGICDYDEENDIITYNEEDNTLVILDLKNFVLKRDNNNISLVLDFKQEKGTMLVKDLDKCLDLDLKVNNLRRERESFLVDYLMNEDIFVYDIKWNMDGE